MSSADSEVGGESVRTARARALSVVSNLFFFSYPPHLLSVFFFFSPPMHSDQDFDDDDADCLYSQPPPESQSGSVLNLDYDDGRAVDTQSTQHMPRPPLRSKPAMYFSGHHSAVGSEFGFSQSTSSFRPHPHAPSHMSGSTLRSTFDPSITQPYTRKAYSPINPPDLPADILEALSESQLYQNPIHRRLQHNYAELCETLTKYIGRDLAAPRFVQSDVPDIYPGT